jgi:hypothetical protein
MSRTPTYILDKLLALKNAVLSEFIDKGVTGIDENSTLGELLTALHNTESMMNTTITPTLANLLSENMSSFETDVSDFLGMAETEIISKDYDESTIDGEYALKCITAGLQGIEGLITVFPDHITVPVGGVPYTFSIYVKGSTGEELNIKLDDDDSTEIVELVELTGEWQRVSLTIIPVSTLIRISIYTNEIISMTFWIDALQLEAGEVATEYGSFSILPINSETVLSGYHGFVNGELVIGEGSTGQPIGNISMLFMEDVNLGQEYAIEGSIEERILGIEEEAFAYCFLDAQEEGEFPILIKIQNIHQSEEALEFNPNSANSYEFIAEPILPEGITNINNIPLQFYIIVRPIPLERHIEDDRIGIFDPENVPIVLNTVYKIDKIPDLVVDYESEDITLDDVVINLSNLFELDKDQGNYLASGTISLDPIQAETFLKMLYDNRFLSIYANSTTPTNTSVIIQYAITENDQNGDPVAPQSWETLPDPEYITSTLFLSENYCLWIRAVLATTDNQVTPTIQDINISNLAYTATVYHGQEITSDLLGIAIVGLDPEGISAIVRPIYQYQPS